MNYDELNPILKEHGARIGVPNDPIRNYSGPVEHVSDEEAVRKDHGVGFGVRHDSIRDYSGPVEHVSDEEAVRRDHGAGFGVPASGIETYGTDEAELKKIFQKLSYANGVKDVNLDVAQLPDASLIKIIEQRYRRSNDILTDKVRPTKEQLTDLGKSLDVDFAIIMETINQKRDVFGPVFNKSCYVGESDLTNIMGIIQEYKSLIEQYPVSINLIDGMTGKEHIDNNTGKVMDSMSGIDYLTVAAQKVALEKGIELSSKSL